MLNVILWIVFGGLAGWLATLIMSKDASYGIVGNIILGIVGAFVGGFIVSFFGAGFLTGGFDLVSFLVAIFGAIVVLGVVGWIRKGAF